MKNGRDLVNGARVLPQGFKLNESWANFDDAIKRKKELNKKAKQNKLGYKYNVSGVTGNYCILCYTGDKVSDRRYN